MNAITADVEDSATITPSRGIERVDGNVAELLATAINTGPRFAEGTVIRFQIRSGRGVNGDWIRYTTYVAILIDGDWQLASGPGDHRKINGTMSTADLFEVLRGNKVESVAVATEWQAVL